MKRAEWTRSFWAKAAAFALAVLCAPLACVCGGSLLAAYEFEWWTGGNEDYREFLLWAQNKYWTLRGANALCQMRYAAIPLLALSVLLLLFFAVYLARAAGRRAGTDEIGAGWQEKLPFDLYLGLDIFAVIALICAADEGFGALWDEPLACAALLLGIVTALAALALGTWMTLCVRVKLGKWWRNTLVFQTLRLCRRFAGWCLRCLRAVPTVWRTVLLLLGLSLVEFVFMIMVGFDSAPLFGGWLFERLLLFSAVIWLSIQLKRLQTGAAALAGGDLDARVDTKHMYWELRRHGENLNDISHGMQAAVDRQLKSERLKTELITNVSHDIKTPLTSIINYVDLLRRDPDGEQAGEYLEVLDRQSKRLKKLTEDLVEMSKASSGNIPVNASRRSVNELLSQALGEYGERLERAKLEPVLTLPEKELFVWADGTLLWRVVDNVLSNACKYALPGTRFYIEAREAAGKAALSFKNISRDALNIPADELMERFVRGDASRGGEGSGLGLNIAKSLTEIQGGSFRIAVDGDLFRVDVTLNAMD